MLNQSVFCVSMASACSTMSLWLSGTFPSGVNRSMSCGRTCANPPAASPCDMPSCCAIWPMEPVPSTSCSALPGNGMFCPVLCQRRGLVGVAALAEFVEDALDAAVLLQQLQRHLEQRILRLLALDPACRQARYRSDHRAFPWVTSLFVQAVGRRLTPDVRRPRPSAARNQAPLSWLLCRT